MSSLTRISTRLPLAYHASTARSLPVVSFLARGYADQSEGKGGDVNQAVTGRTPPGPKQGNYPKILDDSPPSEPSQEVKKHNQEFENRHDRAANKINPDDKDSVGKGFWSGDVGKEDPKDRPT